MDFSGLISIGLPIWQSKKTSKPDTPIFQDKPLENY